MGWLTLTVPRTARCVDTGLTAIPPDEDGEPEEEDLKGVGRRLHWENSVDGWSGFRNALTGASVPFVGFVGGDGRWPELALVSVDGQEHLAASVSCEVVVQIDMQTGEPDREIVEGMKESVEARNKAIEAIRCYVP